MDDRQEVIVADVRIGFWSLVVLMVKVVLASIPALLILYFMAYFAIAAALSMLGVGASGG